MCRSSEDVNTSKSPTRQEFTTHGSAAKSTAIPPRGSSSAIQASGRCRCRGEIKASRSQLSLCCLQADHVQHRCANFASGWYNSGLKAQEPLVTPSGHNTDVGNWPLKPLPFRVTPPSTKINALIRAYSSLVCLFWATVAGHGGGPTSESL